VAFASCRRRTRLGSGDAMVRNRVVGRRSAGGGGSGKRLIRRAVLPCASLRR